MKVIQALLISTILLSPLSKAAEVNALPAERCKAMHQGKVISEAAPVPCERLRVVSFSYIDFQGQLQNNGEVVVMDAVADQVADVFVELLALKFPIQQAKAMEHYQGSDDAAMAANNTSAFVFRAITGNNRFVSLHAYGVAIDINPVQNPYISFGEKGTAQFKPEAGKGYANRTLYRWGKPVRQGLAEAVVDVFARHGFVYWGGYWNTPIDYQHFQTSREMAEFMAAAPPALATRFFQHSVDFYQACEAVYPAEYQRREFSDYTAMIKAARNSDEHTLLSIYQKNPEALTALINAPVKASLHCVNQ